MRVILMAAIVLLLGCDNVDSTDQADAADSRFHASVRILPSQTWINCDGYITNNPASGFCQETLPKDWSPFSFNGSVYFHVPLAYGLSGAPGSYAKNFAIIGR